MDLVGGCLGRGPRQSAWRVIVGSLGESGGDSQDSGAKTLIRGTRQDGNRNRNRFAAKRYLQPMATRVTHLMQPDATAATVGVGVGQWDPQV
jgi:hypothetical protein